MVYVLAYPLPNKETRVQTQGRSKSSVWKKNTNVGNEDGR